MTACSSSQEKQSAPNLFAAEPAGESNPDEQEYSELFFKNPAYHADGFNFPAGYPNAKDYYNAQGFKKNNHLGDDWNGKGGGNSDLGDPVHAIANGFVNEASHQGASWGNVIRIVHGWKENNEWHFVESLYAHLDTMLVRKNQWVKKGQKIGTIGNADGAYYAHLHLEIRSEAEMNLGGGYSYDTTGYLNPTEFIKSHRVLE